METKKLAKIMKALSNPNRLELYIEIARQHEKSYASKDVQCYISDMMCCLNIGAPTISHHLKELTNADLIITEKKGKFLVARINEETVKEVNKILTLGNVVERKSATKK
jgi:ArsR family transcriptional regulator, arsenate/arsenite/antimonite-responsive transcriptional repressor